MIKKPKILSDEKILKAQEDYIQRTYQQVRVTLELPLRGFRRDECLLQVALDDCYKEMLGQFKEWGYSSCPHEPSNLQAIKAFCPECWLEFQLEEA